MNTLRKYKEHLFNNTTDGYIQLIRFEENRSLKIYSTEINGLRDIVEELEGEKDTFITPNTMYKPFRSVENIRQFRSLYMDLDSIEGDKHYITYKIFELAEKEEIPKPTMISDSGRGLHVYWRIKNAPYGALNTWQELQDMLYYKLKKYGADRKATDGARVLRLPNTINSKNNAICRVLYIDDEIEYTMYDLREKYLSYNHKKIIAAAKKENNKVITNSFFNSYSLHIARAEDLITLCELRKYNVIGCRNMILHCFTYWKGIYIRDLEELENQVKELNNNFIEPLKESEVRAIIRCIPKAIEKFIAYEQGIRTGEKKRVTKGMRDKEGYWYKNETLIERLEITEEEQSKLKTIIGTRIKYDRNNKRRTPRNEEGLTPREQQKKEKEKQIKDLINKGFNMNQVAKELGVNRSTISRSYKHLF